MLRSLGLRNISVNVDAGGNVILPAQKGKFELRAFNVLVALGGGGAIDRITYLNFTFGGVVQVISIPSALLVSTDIALLCYMQAGAKYETQQSGSVYRQCILPLPVDFIMDSRFTVQFAIDGNPGTDVISNGQFMIEDYEDDDEDDGEENDD